MNTDGFDNYQKSQIHQARYLAEADQYRLAQQASGKSAWRVSHRHLARRPMILSLILLAAAITLLTAQPALAHDTPGLEPGTGSLFHDAMLAFTLGNYYFGTEQYHRAVDYFEQSIELLSDAVFELAPQDYANVYRMLGKSQLALGMIAEAQASFESYLMLAGDDADPFIVVFLSERHL